METPFGQPPFNPIKFAIDWWTFPYRFWNAVIFHRPFTETTVTIHVEDVFKSVEDVKPATVARKTNPKVKPKK